MRVLYVDLLFFVNFVVDSLLLHLTGWLRGHYMSWKRIVLGGCIGGALAVVTVFLPSRVPGWLFSMVACGLMLPAAWGWMGVRSFLEDCGLLWGMSMLFSGGVLLLLQGTGAGMVRGGAVYLELSMPILFLGTGMAYGLLSLCGRPGRFRKERAVCSVVCTVGGRCLQFDAFVDTGNLLRDSAGRRVILLSPSLTEKLLMPDEELPAEAESAFLRLSEKYRPGLMPYRTAAGRELLVTLSPDSITVDGERSDAYILGLAPQELEGLPGCRALIGC